MILVFPEMISVSPEIVSVFPEIIFRCPEIVSGDTETIFRCPEMISGIGNVNLLSRKNGRSVMRFLFT